jgi:two-component system chemotaxis sensor kinase CheA
VDEVYKELLETFVGESLDFLEEVEPKLIRLGAEFASGNGNRDEQLATVNDVFRLFHTLKGNSQVFGLPAPNAIAKIAHHAEGLLAGVRAGNLELDQKRVEVLCRTLDLLRKILHSLTPESANATWESPVEAMIVELLPLMEGKSKSPAAASGVTFEDGICWAIEPSPLSDSSTPSDAPGVASVSPPVQSEATPAVSEPVESPIVPESSEVPSVDPQTLPSEVEVNSDMKLLFVQEATELLDKVETALLAVIDATADSKVAIIDEAFRCIHSFKGNCGFMGLTELQTFAHAVESVLEPMKSGDQPVQRPVVEAILACVDALRRAVVLMAEGKEPRIDNMSKLFVRLNSAASRKDAPAQGEGKKRQESEQADASKAVRHDVRVDLRKLDTLIDLVGELVIAEAMVSTSPAILGIEDERLGRAVHQLRRIMLELQDVALSVRMVPLAQAFQKMVRIVHDVSQKTGKKAKLVVRGEDTEVDRTVAEKISDPLVHAVRNAVDHGLEPSDDRLRVGKDETGTVTIEARHESGEVWISIKDDGRGLNKEKIIKKAIERGLIREDSVSHMTESEVFELIFLPGFSTADKLTDVSGRGVGMDVVRRNIEEIKGRVSIESAEGRGTNIVFRIPLTLAVIHGMLVRIGDSKYTIPLLVIQESLRPTTEMITVGPDQQEYLRIREEMVPVVRTHELYNKKPDNTDLTLGICVVLVSQGSRFAFHVDEILGQLQTVIKGLPDNLGRTDSVSGCTILGNGEISLIVDVEGVSRFLLNNYQRHVGASG